MTSEPWQPEKILETSGAYWRAFTIHAAVKLEVFTRIGNDSPSVADVAGALKGDPRGVSMLLNALSAMGLLLKEGGHYRNTQAAKTYLVKDSPQYLGHMVMHHHHLVRAWSQLSEAVLTGSPVRDAAPLEEEVREAFLMGMYNLAMAIAPKVAHDIDLRPRRHLLDVGGGPGTYSVHFCMANPGLEATVYDLPSSKIYAERTIEKFGMVGRVRFLGGDYLKAPIPGTYDVAWLSQILHAEGEKDCQRIFDRVVSTLDPGGIILVHEFLLRDSLDGPVFPAIFSLNMLVNTKAGQSYSEGQVRHMLERAGVRHISRLPFEGPNGSGILSGTV